MVIRLLRQDRTSPRVEYKEVKSRNAGLVISDGTLEITATSEEHSTHYSVTRTILAILRL